MAEKPVPEWLNSEFLTECLQHETNDSKIVVTSFTTSPAAGGPGEHFLGCPFRVRIQYNTEQDAANSKYISLIVKLQHNGSEDVLGDAELAEPLFYNKYMPEALKLLKSQLVPKSYFSPKPAVLVLEDLRQQGFRVHDQTTRLDFDHCSSYVVAAATFHASSFVVHEDHPSLVESLGEEKIFGKDFKVSNLVKSIMRLSLKCLTECIERDEEFKKYGQLMRDISTILWDAVVDVLTPHEGLKVLNQGDPWIPNMMFKYGDSGNLADIRLLDFQLLRYSSPAIDLTWFLWLSADHDVRQHRLDELYQLYTDTFNSQLRQLHCDQRISCEYVKREVLRLNPMAIYIVSISPPFGGKEPIKDFNVFFQEDEEALIAYRMYYDEHFCMYHLPRFLDQLESVGAFECVKQYLP